MDVKETETRTAAAGFARDIDGDGELEYAGANPLYLGISTFGATLVIASLMTWAVDRGVADSAVNGMERAGLATLIIGTAMVILGLIGWAYNPWSDPEALWSMALGVVGLGVVIWQMLDISDAYAINDIGGGLWLAGAACSAAIALSAVILFAPEP